MNDATARPSNETITGANAYTVRPGHTLRAGGRLYREGEKAPLSDADARRLLESGAIAAADGGTDADPLEAAVNGKASDLVDSLDTMDAATLDRVEKLEREGKNRKTVLEGIEAARQRLADAREAELAQTQADANADTGTQE